MEINNKSTGGSLMLWSERMQGARSMLQAIIDCVGSNPKNKLILDENKVYTDAIIRLVMSLIDNTQKFLTTPNRIAYRNHERDKKGKLIKVEAYFI